MKAVNLSGKWECTCHQPDGTHFSYTACVPGSAIADLIKQNKLPYDIFYRDNAQRVSEYEECDYVYTKSFFYDGGADSAIISFERIDTYAEVILNGKTVYISENGNIRHDIEVTNSLVCGQNEITVRLTSPITRTRNLPKREGAFTTERLYTRRMQCTYGWDWVARFLTVGLGECRLILKDKNELYTDNVYIVTTDADNECAEVRVDIAFSESYSGRVIDAFILSPDGECISHIKKFIKEELVRLYFNLKAPRLWYPLGYGEQPIYTFVLKDGEQTVYQESFGIRTVRILEIPDAPESEISELCRQIKNPDYDKNDSFSGFTLKVNEKKIFCRGANWVPCVPFTDFNTDQRQTEILELCAEAGVNMLRVWGGGGFESKHFYSECSRLGITVTQDFLMACGSYPEEDDRFIAELQKEALYAVRLIRNQPALVWWTGDNENAVLGSDSDENYSGRRSAYDGIAPILYKEDPYRRFLPSSPYGGSLYASNTVGTTHNTQYLSRFFDYIKNGNLSEYKEELKKYRARFIAEEPQMGAASKVSLEKFMTEDDIYTSEDMWLYHTKTNPALPYELFDYTKEFAEGVLGKFESGKDRLFKLRYLQYEWLRTVMEQARREKELCSGIIFWMMNDCWPAASGWSLIDYYSLPKDAYYAFKRLSKPTVSTIDKENGEYRCFVINNGEAATLEAKVYILNKADGQVRLISDFTLNVDKNSKTVAYTLNELLDNQTLIFEIRGDNARDRSFYQNGALHIKPADFEFRDNGDSITVKANTYIHALTLTADAVFEDNCFSLMPGECRTVSYRMRSGGVSAEAYTLK